MRKEGHKNKEIKGKEQTVKQGSKKEGWREGRKKTKKDIYQIQSTKNKDEND
jgi:hypothetical protein